MSKITGAQRAEVLRAFGNGGTVSEAAGQAGVTYNQAYHAIRAQHGRRTTPPDPADTARLRARVARGETVRAAAAALGLSEGRAYRLAAEIGCRRKGTHDRTTRDSARAALERGESVSAVARRLELPVSTVQQWSQKNGKSLRPTYDGGVRSRFASLLAEGLSVPQAAAQLGIGTTTAYRWGKDLAVDVVAPQAVRARPVAAWPESMRAVADRLSRDERLAVGRLCAAADLTDTPARDVVTRFLAERSRHISARKVRVERQHLIAGLTKLDPETAWRDGLEGGDHRPGYRKPPGRPRSASVAFSSWPEAQQARWRAACDDGREDPTDEFPLGGGALADLSPSSRRMREAAYGLYFGAQSEEQRSASISPIAVQLFVNACRGRGTGERSIATYVASLANAAPILWPGENFDWLVRTARALRQRAALEPKRKWADAPVDPAVLWSIGCNLTDRARAGDRESRRTAALFRDGVIFMMLSSAPVRLANLTSIEIGTNLLLPADRPGRLTFLRTKAGHSSTHDLWPELRAVLDEYIEIYRPVLSHGRVSNALWLSAIGGERMRASGLAARVVEHTERELGRALSPHRFRDAVATALVIEYPDAPDLASNMLQHRDLSSLAEYTEQGRSVGAARVLREAIGRARVRARRPSAPSRRTATSD